MGWWDCLWTGDAECEEGRLAGSMSCGMKKGCGEAAEVGMKRGWGMAGRVKRGAEAAGMYWGEGAKSAEGEGGSPGDPKGGVDISGCGMPAGW